MCTFAGLDGACHDESSHEEENDGLELHGE